MGHPPPGRVRPRRSVLSVPASNPRFVARAAQTEADAVLFDLEDSVAPARKADTRALIVRALNETDFGGKLRLVRVNALATPWAVRDVVDLVEGAGANLDALMLPKTGSPGDVYALDVMLGSLEAQVGLGHRIGIEAQIESAQGMASVEGIARASSRLETLVFGPGDYAASVGMPVLSIGAVDLATAKARRRAPSPTQGTCGTSPSSASWWRRRPPGCRPSTGPTGASATCRGCAAPPTLDYVLGMDGKWAVHPSQIPILNEVFTPAPEQVAQAEAILARYRQAVEEEGVGAVAFGEEMIDEASRRLAESLLRRTSSQGGARNVAGTRPAAEDRESVIQRPAWASPGRCATRASGASWKRSWTAASGGGAPTPSRAIPGWASSRRPSPASRTPATA